MTNPIPQKIEPLKTEKELNDILTSISLNRSDKEILCSLKTDDPTARQLQLKFAIELENAYREGAKDLTPDLHKAKEYEKQIQSLKTNLYGPDQSELQDEINVSPEPESTRWDKFKSKFTTKNVREFFGWYQAGRLATTRVNRVLNFYGLGFLQPLFAIGGFVYLVSLAIDIGITFYDTFRERREGEKELSRWQMFKNAITKDDRLHRMANDFVWGFGNLAAFLVTGGASAIINICIFAFDIVNDTLKVWRQRERHVELQSKIFHRMFDINEQLNNPENNLTNAEKDELHKESTSLKTFNPFKKPLEEKIHSQSVECLKVLMTTTAICLGMALFLFFPPLSIPALVGAGLALFAGSMYAGLGRRLRNLASSVFNTIKESVKNKFGKTTESPSPAEKPTPAFGQLNEKQLGKLPPEVAASLIHGLEKPAQETPAPEQIANIPASPPITEQPAQENLVTNASADAKNKSSEATVLQKLRGIFSGLPKVSHEPKIPKDKPEIVIEPAVHKTKSNKKPVSFALPPEAAWGLARATNEVMHTHEKQKQASDPTSQAPKLKLNHTLNASNQE